ncbi:type II toxin-antitoxin system PemK/MazF family toxin [Pantoea allii]|uniref:type II toxin-antitoxin system PemK/MazF family toxin n=1 Tax=Pantoea allii TaxID=574096 RepID=UPI003D3178F8
MNNTQICYFIKNSPLGAPLTGKEIQLGKEIHENINEFMLPINYKNTPLFITKKFFGYDIYRWKVELVLGSVSQKGRYDIYLSEKNVKSDVYLNETAKKQNKAFWGIVKKGAIVIVEFGHIYQIANSGGDLKNTYSYPCNHQNGEMHKRRPAIVVSADKNGVKIVPITSQIPDSYPDNKGVFKLDKLSTEYINEFSIDKESYVLCEMIQTISPTRILPPYSRNRKTNLFFRDQSYTRKIIRSDVWELEEALLSSIGLPLLRKEHVENKNKIDELKLQNSQYENDLDAVTQKYVELEKKFAILKQLYIGAEGCFSEREVDNEINEYLAID